MAASTALPVYESVRAYRTEQIIRAFGYTPDSNNKIVCPFHQEEEASLLVNEHYAYCFGCKKHWDNLALVQAFLNTNVRGALRWFAENTLPEPSQQNYTTVSYEGPVNPALIDYWYENMVDESYRVLQQERLLHETTARRYKIGWRPDFAAWSIPFWRGEPGHSEIEIVQFRMTNNKTKYIGLKGHNRGSVMNAHLLEEEQPYIVVLFGSFDALLALQDGVLAVGLNGSNPFRADEKERVQELFSKQKNIFILPDNTPAEFKPAYKLAEWLGGRVIFFPADLPKDTDYIDYRKAGHTVLDFKRDVLRLNFPHAEIENIVELWKCGDPYNFAIVHAANALHKASLKDVAQALFTASNEFTVKEQSDTQSFLRNIETISFRKSGGW